MKSHAIESGWPTVESHVKLKLFHDSMCRGEVLILYSIEMASIDKVLKAEI